MRGSTARAESAREAAALAALGALLLALTAGGSGQGVPGPVGPGISPSSSGSSIVEDPYSPALIPRMDEFDTPVLAPGESGVLSLTITNRYAVPVRGLLVTLEIHRYATNSDSVPVTAATDDGPRLCFEGRPPSGCTNELAIGGNPELGAKSDPLRSRLALRAQVHTSAATPHGSLFDPASYIVRAVVDYLYVKADKNGTVEVPYRLISRGHIADADWKAATAGEGVDIALIRSLYSAPGRPVAGLATDTSFTVRDPVPVWPVYLLGGLAALFGGLALMLHLDERRGWFPWLRSGTDRMVGRVRGRTARAKRPRDRR
jgi:hypothetical protein